MSKQKQTYIAGKISGMDYNAAWTLFVSVEFSLMDKKQECINPMRICERHWSWERCMIVCLYNLIFKCDKIYLIHNWKYSRGARIEVFFAILTGKEII